MEGRVGRLRGWMVVQKMVGIMLESIQLSLICDTENNKDNSLDTPHVVIQMFK